MDDGSKPGKPEFEFGGGEPKPAAPNFDWGASEPERPSGPEPVAPAPGQLQRPPEPRRGNTVSDLYAVARKSKSGKFVLALATGATIIGGVAACVQIYDYFVKPKPGPYAPRTTTGGAGDKPNEPPIDATPVLQAGPHFQIKAPKSWIVVDRGTYQASNRMRYGSSSDLNARDAYEIDTQYLMRTKDAAADGVYTCVLKLIENNIGRTIEDLNNDLVAYRNGLNGGYIDGPDKLIRLEGFERLETASGDVMRVICSQSLPEKPGEVVSVLNYFYCFTKSHIWYAMFILAVGSEFENAQMILDMAKSIEVYD